MCGRPVAFRPAVEKLVGYARKKRKGRAPKERESNGRT